MLKERIVIGVLAKDCAAALSKNISRVEKLGRCFLSYDVVVLENDSKDETKEILRKWESNNERVRVLSKDGFFSDFTENRASIKHPGMSLSRISRMAKLRNELIDYVRKNFDLDIYMLLDIDVEDFSVEGIVESLKEAPNDWGGLFANGRHTRSEENKKVPIPFQYDYFAYLPKGKSINEYFSKIFFNRFFKPYIEFRMNCAIQKTPFWECHSAFGGVGLYKWSVVKDFSYEIFIPSSFEKDNSCVCEHVPFNMKVVAGGAKNYVASKMQVDYGKNKDLDDDNLLFKFFTVPYVFFAYSLKSPVKKILRKLHLTR